MKIRNIFSLVLASALLFTACDKEVATDSFDNIKVSSTFLTFPAKGGSVDLTVTTTEDWKFVRDENWPEKITFNTGVKVKHDFWGNVTNVAEDIASTTTSWVTASVLEGKSGEMKVTFTASAFAGGREQTVAIVCGSHKQHVVLRQGNLDPEKLSIEEALAAPEGKTVRVAGTVTGIYNTEYGNWYLTDGTKQILVYGTLDKEGKEKNFASLKIEEGDKIVVEGPISVYNSVNQLKNVTVIEHTKSLVKLISESKTDVKLEGETFVVELEFKGDGLYPVVPEEYQDWISILGVKTEAGKPTKLDPNPASKAFVTVKVAANAAGDRKGKIDFSSSSSSSDGKVNTSSVSYEFIQKGAIMAVSVSEFLAAKESETVYRLKGVITKIEASSKYHNAEITIASGDFKESVLLHRAIVADGNIEDKNYAVGDVVTVLGKRSSYKEAPAMAEKCVVEECAHYEAKTIAAFLELKPAAEPLYAVSGTIKEFKGLNESYNNVGITIESDGKTLYCHRVQTYDKPKSNVVNLGLKIGDKITIVGARGEYKGAAQMAQYGFIIQYTPVTETK